MNEPRSNPPRFHFDPARGDLPTDRKKIVDWCISHAFYADIDDMPPAVAELLKVAAGKGVGADETRRQLIAILTRASHVTVDFIWDLAREFGFDPIESEPDVLKDLLFHQIDIEAAVEMGGHPSEAKDVMDAYRETVRDVVRMSAIRTAAGDSLRTLTEDIATGDHRPHVESELLLEEIVEIMRWNIKG